MEFYYFAYEGFLYLCTFMLSLVVLYFLFQIIRRTNKKLKVGYIVLFLSAIAFSISMAFEVLSRFQILSIQMLPGISSTLFIILFLIGIWKIRQIIKDLSDYGQTLLLVTKENYAKKLLGVLKQSQKICYVYLSDLPPHVEVLASVNQQALTVITSSSEFLSSKTIQYKTDTFDSLKQLLDKTLSEHRCTMVCIDSITSLPNIQPFEFPLAIQQLRSIMKQHSVSGYFIADTKQLDYEIIDDISMIVDRIER